MNKLKPKPMKYQATRKIELLYNDIYEGYHYYILNLGTHPTAYIEIPRNNILFGKDYEEIYKMNIDIWVNGGLTYSDNNLWIGDGTVLHDSWFIGWDYGHCDDYTGYELNMPMKLRHRGKKWTTEEIIEECEQAIDQLDVQLKGMKINGC